MDDLVITISASVGTTTPGRNGPSVQGDKKNKGYNFGIMGVAAGVAAKYELGSSTKILT